MPDLSVVAASVEIIQCLLAARFWEISDPRLAVLVHSVVGGTPAYRRELVREDTPADVADFDAFVIRTVLNPQTPLFREARYLLAEETEIRDPSLYHSVLAAVAEGNNTSGGIASYIGRKSNEVAHPLRVLEDCRLLIKEPDLFRSGRARYTLGPCTPDRAGLACRAADALRVGAICSQLLTSS